MIDLSESGPVCVQQKTQGSGTFDGTMAGWARASYSAGSGVAKFRARVIGAAGNAYKIRMVDPGKARTRTTVSIQGTTVTVMLKRSSSAITATLAEVAAALHAFRGQVPVDPSSDNRNGTILAPSPIIMGVTTNDTAHALSLTSLSGGVDGVQDGTFVRYDLANNVHGGMFYFDAKEAMEVFQVEGSAAITGLKVANVDDAIQEISGESADYTGLLSSGIYEGPPLMLAPKQALLVTMATQGIVRVFARRASRRQ